MMLGVLEQYCKQYLPMLSLPMFITQKSAEQLSVGDISCCVGPLETVPKAHTVRTLVQDWEPVCGGGGVAFWCCF